MANIYGIDWETADRSVIVRRNLKQWAVFEPPKVLKGFRGRKL